MKILLLEYITGGGLAGLDLPDSLAQEGRLMATALSEDLLALPDVHLFIPWDARLAAPNYCADVRGNLQPITNAAAFQRCWAKGLTECDAVWPIAPETDSVLERLCREVEQAGLRLLNSPAAAIALTASKSATSKRLAAHGIATISHYPLHTQPVNMPWPRVVKPDDGVGCVGAYRIDSLGAWTKHFDNVSAGNMQVLPYVPGPSLSLSALFFQGDALLLTVNRQQIQITTDSAFQLTGCEVNSIKDATGVYSDLAKRIAQAIPELAGYVGVDFIQSAQGPVVLEINPRLTSSYAVLGRSLGLNPAKLVLDLFENGSLPSVLLDADTRPTKLRFPK